MVSQLSVNRISGGCCGHFEWPATNKAEWRKFLGTKLGLGPIPFLLSKATRIGQGDDMYPTGAAQDHAWVRI